MSHSTSMSGPRFMMSCPQPILLLDASFHRLRRCQPTTWRPFCTALLLLHTPLPPEAQTCLQLIPLLFVRQIHPNFIPLSTYLHFRTMSHKHIYTSYLYHTNISTLHTPVTQTYLHFILLSHEHIYTSYPCHTNISTLHTSVTQTYLHFIPLSHEHIYTSYPCHTNIWRVSDQNGISLQWYRVEIYHSGRKPSISILHTSITQTYLQFIPLPQKYNFTSYPCHTNIIIYPSYPCHAHTSTRHTSLTQMCLLFTPLTQTYLTSYLSHKNISTLHNSPHKHIYT